MLLVSGEDRRFGDTGRVADRLTVRTLLGAASSESGSESNK